jgi:undecaprenyl-diphosphatase
MHTAVSPERLPLIERARPQRLLSCVSWLDRHEIDVVRSQAALARRPAVRRLVRISNALGNGWMYPLFAIGLWVVQPGRALIAIEAAVSAVVIAHIVYPFAKAFVGRERPCNRCADLPAFMKPLDRYSCPSGHTMTACAAFLPVGVVFPIAGAIAVCLWLILAWTRIAAAHHYPTDVVLGAVLGAVAAVAPMYLLLR